MTNIKIMGIAHNSIVDGTGIRDVIFTSGCPHHCYKCHNPETWNIDNGKSVCIEDILSKLNFLCDLTLSGGEPFLQADDLKELLIEYKKKKNKHNIWIYSGYSYENLISNKKFLALLRECDVLVDGQYVDERRDVKLKFRGSSNQRIIDVQKSLSENKVVLYME